MAMKPVVKGTFWEEVDGTLAERSMACNRKRSLSDSWVSELSTSFPSDDVGQAEACDFLIRVTADNLSQARDVEFVDTKVEEALVSELSTSFPSDAEGQVEACDFLIRVTADNLSQARDVEFVDAKVEEALAENGYTSADVECDFERVLDAWGQDVEEDEGLEYAEFPVTLVMSVTVLRTPHCSTAHADRPAEMGHGEESAHSAPTGAVASGARTTLMLRNMPAGSSCLDLCTLLDSQSFAGAYDFAYVPLNFKKTVAFGYAFVNFTSHAEAERAKQHFVGFSWTFGEATSSIVVEWSHPHQGLQCHVERLRNCPVMHEIVPDFCKPMLFRNGARVEFPAPTVQLCAPRDVRKHLIHSD